MPLFGVIVAGHERWLGMVLPHDLSQEPLEPPIPLKKYLCYFRIDCESFCLL